MKKLFILVMFVSLTLQLDLDIIKVPHDDIYNGYTFSSL